MKITSDKLLKMADAVKQCEKLDELTRDNDIEFILIDFNPVHTPGETNKRKVIAFPPKHLSDLLQFLKPILETEKTKTLSGLDG